MIEVENFSTGTLASEFFALLSTRIERSLMIQACTKIEVDFILVSQSLPSKDRKGFPA